MHVAWCLTTLEVRVNVLLQRSQCKLPSGCSSSWPAPFEGGLSAFSCSAINFGGFSFKYSEDKTAEDTFISLSDEEDLEPDDAVFTGNISKVLGHPVKSSPRSLFSSRSLRGLSISSCGC